MNPNDYSIMLNIIKDNQNNMLQIIIMIKVMILRPLSVDTLIISNLLIIISKYQGKYKLYSRLKIRHDKRNDTRYLIP